MNTCQPAWANHLEIVGAELFQRYRKRLMQPGILFEIRRDYPALSWPDLLVRVHAGRQIIRNGGDFEALAAIRSGTWRGLPCAGVPATPETPSDDVLSRFLVQLGQGLFAGLCLLSLMRVVMGLGGV